MFRIVFPPFIQFFEESGCMMVFLILLIQDNNPHFFALLLLDQIEDIVFEGSRDGLIVGFLPVQPAGYIFKHFQQSML